MTKINYIKERKIRTLRYGECGVISNGNIYTHVGKKFDIHYLLKLGLMSKVQEACFSGIVHRLYPLFFVEGKYEPSINFKVVISRGIGLKIR